MCFQWVSAEPQCRQSVARSGRNTHAKAERAIRGLLEAYLQEHPSSKPEARVRVARCSGAGTGRVEIVGVAALVGAKRTAAKARASRANGRLAGGRGRS